MKPNIELHIDEMILRGVPYVQRRRVVAAIEVELMRLLGEQDLPETLAQDGALPQIKLDELPEFNGMKAQAIGTQIAQQVYGKLAGNTTNRQSSLQGR